ncbi:hypothetical protein FRC02_008122 [Tulasnella sp. 418]|nr:hypothetical protein FRC02_008122 [Tulasnella sp. 418]
MSHWPCFAAGTWKLENLVSRFRNVTFRVEAFECPISVYSSYAKDCTTEDCPLYLFDAKFVEKTGGTMGHEYAPLEFLGPDLFEGLGSDRPDYRWLIVGPSRSGSTFHKDPNGSAAWNAVVQGRKGWVLFHPDVCPPGVYVNSDESEVTAPLSLAEWFLGYFESSWKIYGPDGRDPSKRGRMMVGICEAGEIVYVPSGWWHLVINLEDSVAVTQNFVSMTELSGTLKFMMDKPDQLSGFSSIEKGVVHAKFLETLRVTKPDLSDWLHDCPGRPPDTRSSLWDSLNQDRSQDVSREFSFGFDLQDDESESSENL